MSAQKTKTKKTYTLSEFHSYLDSRNKPKPQQGGRLSDRLRKNDLRLGSRPSHQGRDASKAPRAPGAFNASRAPNASRASKTPAPLEITFDSKDFPKLDQELETVLDSPNLGCWSQGIQTIRDAKDLPDPVMMTRREHQRARYVKQHYTDDRYDSYDSYDSAASYDSDTSNVSNVSNDRARNRAYDREDACELDKDDANWDDI